MVVLICISVNASEVELLFILSLGHLYVFFGEVSVQVLCTFFNWIVFVWGRVEFCKFFINLVNIFSHPVGCLFFVVIAGGSGV